MFTKIDVSRGVLWVKTTICAATKGFVGGGQKWGKGYNEKNEGQICIYLPTQIH